MTAGRTSNFVMVDRRPAVLVPAEAETTTLVLDVTIPAAKGQVDDLLVSSIQLSQQQLVSVFAQGLTGSASASSTTTVAPASGTGT
ncbi:MAG: hypothetical protein ABSD97_17380 [Acidimicrobiales bacterium]|jgi:hypothetical protein